MMGFFQGVLGLSGTVWILLAILLNVKNRLKDRRQLSKSEKYYYYLNLAGGIALFGYLISIASVIYAFLNACWMGASILVLRKKGVL